MEPTINKKVLFENFAGRSTPLEKKLIERWLQSPVNRELYYEWLHEWELAHPQFFPNEEKALQKIRTDAEGQERLGFSTNSRPAGLTRIFRFGWIAAAVVVVGVSIYLFRGLVFYRSLSTAYGETRSVILPDGSLVNLNGHSMIRFRRFGFGKRDREVFLAGEADFSVIHSNSNQPFQVLTENRLDVTVLGTRFTVYARGEEARVVLKQGKVELDIRKEKETEKLIMRPGDLFKTNAHGDHTIERTEHPENFSTWKDHQFQFDSTPLSGVAKMLSDNFGLEVYFDNADLAQRQISGSYHADTAPELIDAIAQILNVKYKLEGNVLYFFGH